MAHQFLHNCIIQSTLNNYRIHIHFRVKSKGGEGRFINVDYSSPAEGWMQNNPNYESLLQLEVFTSHPQTPFLNASSF
jgi:hypothetical protein